MPTASEKIGTLTKCHKAALAYAEAIAWRLETDDAFWERMHRHFSEPELVELGCMIGLTFGQQSWLRLLGIEHHEVMAGSSASMAPGFETAEALRETKGSASYWAQAGRRSEGSPSPGDGRHRTALLARSWRPSRRSAPRGEPGSASARGAFRCRPQARTWLGWTPATAPCWRLPAAAPPCVPPSPQPRWPPSPCAPPSPWLPGSGRPS